MAEIKQINTLLHNNFHIKNFGELKYFLGFEVARSKKGIHLYQREFALDLLTETWMLKQTFFHSLSEWHKISIQNRQILTDPSSYHMLIGKLLYLINTRADLCFSINLLSQFMQTLTNYHYWDLQHILRYIKSSPSQRLFFAANLHVQTKSKPLAQTLEDLLLASASSQYPLLSLGSLRNRKLFLYLLLR